MAELTVATLNLFINPEGRWPQRAPLVVRQFLEICPDVIGFQEVDHSIDQANWLVNWINSELGRQDYVAYHMVNPQGVSGFESLAIVSKLPVIEHDGLDYLIMGNIAHRVRVKLNDGLALDFYNTHLYWVPGKEGGDLRHKQATRLLQWEAMHKGATCQVIVGDFNAIPTGQTIALMKRTFRSAHERAHGREPDRTWPTPLISTVSVMRTFGIPSLPPDYTVTLDYIFISQGVEVLEARLAFDQPNVSDPTLYPSDHFGLTARLQVDEEPVTE
jgi:endonuclease/exonuclease/phosphatase family metal-dependent hydrolase